MRFDIIIYSIAGDKKKLGQEDSGQELELITNKRYVFRDMLNMVKEVKERSRRKLSLQFYLLLLIS